jgi:hypothetical protein
MAGAFGNGFRARGGCGNPKSKIQNSFDHFIRPRQHVRRNRQADLLCRFEIDDKFFGGRMRVSPVVNFAAEFSVPALFWLSGVNPFLRNQQSYSLGFLRRVVTKIPV